MSPMTSHTAPRETEVRSEAASPQGGRVPSRFRAFAGAVGLTLGILAALAAGGWGVISSLSAEAPPARVGEEVEVTGGTVRVEKVTPEHMAPMKSSKFSAGSMSMSSTGMDMAPEGYERFAVEVTLFGRGGDLAYAPKDFRLSGPGVKDHGPIRSQLPAGTVPDGSAVAGNMTFQAPEEAKGLQLSFDSGRPVALDLPASNDDGHGH